MSWACLTLSIFLVSGFRVEANELTNLVVAVQSALESRCLKNADENSLEELKNSMLGLKTCLEPAQSEPLGDEELFNIVCKDLPEITYGCLEGILKKLKPCLDEEEKFLSDFLIDTFNSTFDEACQGGATGVIELANSIKDSECMQSTEILKAKLIEKCLPELKVFKGLENPDFVLSKSDFCSDLDNVNECAISVLREVCEDDVFENVLWKSFTPYLSWCFVHTP